MLNIPKHLLKLENNIQSLLIKADKKINEKEQLPFQYLKDYYDALNKYVAQVFKGVVDGIAIELKVDPTKLKKSIKLPLNDLIRIAGGDLDDRDMLYKGFFDKLKGKLSFFQKWLKRFNFNRGRSIEPLKFKNKIAYNPVTKKALTNKEWDDITNDITNYLKDKIGGLNEELYVRAGLMGKLAQKMEQEGINLGKQKKINYEQLTKKFGDLSQTLKEAKKEFDLSEMEENSIQYAMDMGAEYLAIPEGDIRNKIVHSVRKHLTEGLRRGDSAQQLTSRMYWIDPSDELGAMFSDDTVEAWNRDWRRVALTEMSYAQSHGYITAHKSATPTEKVYMVFSGSVIKTSSKKCIASLGEIVLVVDDPLTDDKIKDPYANYAIWLGKNNVGRNQNDWWICIPMHPNCIHYWERIDPTTQEWDKEINKIVYKEET